VKRATHGAKAIFKKSGFLAEQNGGGIDVAALIKKADDAAIERGNTITFSMKPLEDKVALLAVRWGARVR
jgi:hypothetical protein